MSKDLFYLMREQEVTTDSFLPTKKELKLSSTNFAKEIIDSGNHNVEQIYAQALRLKESLTTIEAYLKTKLPQENFEAYGLTANYRSGGNTVNYKDDDKWSDLKAQLTHRETLLKAALSSEIEIYDEEGVQVPKVSTTPRKSSLAISY